MEFIEVQLEEIQHEHPLILEDLQSMYQNYEEDDDDFEDHDLIATQNFKCICDICGFEIDWYHRYHYKCSLSSCSYSIHKFCGEIPTTIRFPAHPIHTLHLNKMSNSWSCHSCHSKHQDGICYHCSMCNYKIDLSCVTYPEQTRIYHPGHPHQLISIAINPTLSNCYACEKEHKGVFYHCITCFNFSIHVDCVTLPFKLTLNHHVHMLTLSYSYPVTPSHRKCRICGMSFSENIWLYKCSKCRYYVHLDCATMKGDSSTSIFLRGKLDTNFKATDYPNLLHYPLYDESYNILPQQVLKGNYQHLDNIIFDKGSYMHSSHSHPLLLINALDTSILGIQPTLIHNPMMRIKLLCDGCLRPVTTTPFYVCGQVVSGCNFYLHEWCARLPKVLENHTGHPQHPLSLFHSSPSRYNYTGFECNCCRLRCIGFGYECCKCYDYRIDVHCGFIPERITHEAHPSHLLSFASTSSIGIKIRCNACDVIISGSEICFVCDLCDFRLHNRCALHLPKTIKNKYDKHPLKLSYLPIENHKSEYFCEVCEEELDPEKWFYHCQECAQSIHSACAPLILQSEQDANSPSDQYGVYKFLNLKFGGLLAFKGHTHSFSFLVGTKSDWSCFICQRDMQSLLIFKCITCKVAFHTHCGREGRTTWSALKDQQIKNFWAERFRHPIKTKEKNEDKPAVALTFYAGEVIRPVTRHWKVVD